MFLECYYKKKYTFFYCPLNRFSPFLLFSFKGFSLYYFFFTSISLDLFSNALILPSQMFLFLGFHFNGFPLSGSPLYYFFTLMIVILLFSFSLIFPCYFSLLVTLMIILIYGFCLYFFLLF